MELYELSLYHLTEGLRAKKFSPEEVYESCKKRIDSCEENIHAFITRTDEIAKTQLNEDNSGILAGVPTVLKDNLCTKDKNSCVKNVACGQKMALCSDLICRVTCNK